MTGTFIIINSNKEYCDPSQSCCDKRCVILNSTFWLNGTVLKFGGYMSLFGIFTIVLELKQIHKVNLLMDQ